MATLSGVRRGFEAPLCLAENGRTSCVRFPGSYFTAESLHGGFQRREHLIVCEGKDGIDIDAADGGVHYRTTGVEDFHGLSHSGVEDGDYALELVLM